MSDGLALCGREVDRFHGMSLSLVMIAPMLVCGTIIIVMTTCGRRMPLSRGVETTSP